MANYKIAVPGHQYTEGKINLAWGVNAEKSDVQEVKSEDQTPGFKSRVLAGIIVETKDPATRRTDGDAPVYRILEGDEARKVMAEPAGPVTVRVFSPKEGKLVDVELAHVPDLSEAAASADREEAARSTEESPGDISSISRPEPEAEPSGVEMTSRGTTATPETKTSRNRK